MKVARVSLVEPHPCTEHLTSFTHANNVQVH